VRPDHLSLYPLSIEPRTVFARRRRENALLVPEDEAVAEMYHLACDRLREAGYTHYEVANWSLPGHECRHNLACWYNRELYAIGVGAHGYLKPYRTENIRQTGRYIERIAAGESPVESSILVDRSVELSETVMLRLRLLQDGLDLRELERSFGRDTVSRFGPEVRELTAAGLLKRERGRVALMESAVPVANEVWQRFV
jgi:oxygen-independent coproporphyrinogen-3 oxidase